MSINSIGGGGNLGQVLGGGQRIAQPVKVDIPVPVKQPTQQAVQIDVPDPVVQNAKRRAENVRVAAEQLKTFFPISSVRFVTFKDAGGDYITKFTSLLDGSVKYFPEKTMFDIVRERTNSIRLPIDIPAGPVDTVV